ncbi:MAG: PDZ domain-containing protein [Deltaproteobacteria bacterium]|jgi:S1-C subfamily serine protease|nr:PDZ domain-containing protein [Deltaproteobacteria bacterium]
MGKGLRSTVIFITALLLTGIATGPVRAADGGLLSGQGDSAVSPSPQGGPAQSPKPQPDADRALEIAPAPPWLGGPAQSLAPALPPPRAERDTGRRPKPSPAAAPAAKAAAPTNPSLPYVGLTVQAGVIEKDGQKMPGLLVMEVEPQSPAARAGIRGAVAPGTTGATIATATSLLAPFDQAIGPLVKRSDIFGRSGDLIVAVDGHRVVNQQELFAYLTGVRPGEIIYLDVVRELSNGRQTTLTIPVVTRRPGSRPGSARR